MKKQLIRIATVFTLVLPATFISCNNNSEIKELEKPEKKESTNLNQSGWSHEERLQAIQEMEDVRPDLEAVMGDKTDAYTECYLSSLEAEFPNLVSIAENPDKVVEISTSCAQSVMEQE